MQLGEVVTAKNMASIRRIIAPIHGSDRVLLTSTEDSRLKGVVTDVIDDGKQGMLALNVSLGRH